mmetsp:Transcript_94203/g.196591  ORF Transcript_94203/g.196591 Transcript_94203/m.196591 type:complete len:569 (+) Transcript_94203:150-1856(+)
MATHASEGENSHRASSVNRSTRYAQDEKKGQPPRMVAEFMASLNLEPRIEPYDLLQKECSDLVHMADVEAVYNHRKAGEPPACAFIGFCFGGLCLLRLSAAFYHFIGYSTRSKHKLEDMAAKENPTAPQELRKVVARLLHILAATNNPGMISLQMIMVRPDVVWTLVDMLRAHIAQPKAEELHAPDERGTRVSSIEGVRPNSLNNAVGQHILLICQALDAVFAVMLAEVEGLDGDLQRSVLRRRPPVAKPLRKGNGVKDNGHPTRTAAGAAAAAAAAEHSFVPEWWDKVDVLSQTIKSLWIAIDYNHNNQLEEREITDFKRLMFNRPVLSLLVRSRMVDFTRNEQADAGDLSLMVMGGSSQSRGVRLVPEGFTLEAMEALGQACVFEALAAANASYSRDFWDALDSKKKGGSRVTSTMTTINRITGSQFCENFKQAFEEHILDVVAEAASEKFENLLENGAYRSGSKGSSSMDEEMLQPALDSDRRGSLPGVNTSSFLTSPPMDSTLEGTLRMPSGSELLQQQHEQQEQQQQQELRDNIARPPPPRAGPCSLADWVADWFGSRARSCA